MSTSIVSLRPETQAFESAEQKQLQLRTLIALITRVDSPSKGLIVSGAPGIGKTHTTLHTLEQDPTISINLSKGNITPLALFYEMRQARQKNQVCVFDDCDAVFSQIRALNLLKGATDPASGFEVAWMSPRTEGIQKYSFHGKIIILTNNSMKTSPHYQALLDRMLYIRYELTLLEIHAIAYQMAVTAIENGQPEEWIADAYSWFIERKDLNLTLRKFEKACNLAVSLTTMWRDLAPNML